MRVLVTGASGLLGTALATELRNRGHIVVGVSRAQMPAVDIEVRGDFREPSTLERCDEHSVDAVVHLAAEVGGCTEEAGFEVNVEGTRRLLRHFLERGVSQFVVASSIAAAVGLDRDVVPSRLPVKDSAVSIATDGYGLSKWLMEQVVFYFNRQFPESAFFLPRIGVVLKPDSPAASKETVAKALFPLVSLTTIALEDVVRAFIAALEAVLSPGVHRYNLVSPWIRSPFPVLETLPLLYPNINLAADVSHYSQPEAAYASFFESTLVWEFLGIEPTIDPRGMTRTEEGKMNR